VLEENRLEEVARLERGLPDPRALARELLGRGWLTAFQVNQLLQGRGAELALGPYVLLERLGKGGMGQVFKARHRLMNRVVALKVIRPDFLAREGAAQRFRREIQAAAQLSHPNIVHAYDADCVGQTHFLVMEYVEGIDLAKLLKERGRQPVAQACEYARQAALGLQHAHERGLIHRDIKPSNLLVARAGGALKVLDMGLARLEMADKAAPKETLTEDGAVMGTPDYIAPEQALDTHRADHRADIYSLGCTLYHLLTGRPPFPDGALTQKLLWHQQVEPVPVERLRVELPTGLALVVRKMMAKRPADRYQTAGEVAGALELFARCAVPAGAAVRAEPVSADATSLQSPQLVPVQIVAAVDTVASASAESVSSEQPLPSVRPAAKPVSRRPRHLLAAGGALVVALVALWLLTRKGTDPLGEWKNRPEVRQQNELIWETPKELRQILGEDRAHHWGTVQCVAVSPDGKLAATGGSDRIIRVWDTATMTGKVVLRGHTDTVTALAFAPNSRTLLSGSADRTAHLWDVETGKEERQFTNHPNTVVKAAFTADGLTAFTDANHTTYIWEVKSGKQVTSVGALAGSGAALFTPVGRRWARLEPDRIVRVREWPEAPARALDVIAAERAREKKDEKAPRIVVTLLGLSGDGNRLLLGTSDGLLRFWDVNAGKELNRWKTPFGGVRAASLADDGKRALLSCADGSCRLWNLETFKEVCRLEGYAGDPVPVFLAGGGRALGGGGTDGAVRLWDLATGKELHAVAGHTAAVRSLSFSADGRSLLSGGSDRMMYLWNVKEGEIRQSFVGHAGGILGVVFSPDGWRVLSVSDDRTLRVWRAENGEALMTFGQIEGDVVAGSPQGNRAVTCKNLAGYTTRLAALANVENGQTPALYQGSLGAIRCAALLPDGKRLLLGGADSLVRLYEVENGKELARFGGHTDTVLCVSPSGDGKQFLTVSADKTVRLWHVDEQTARRRTVLKNCPANLSSMAISSDGKRVAASTMEGKVLVWDTLSGTEVISWQLPGSVYRVAFHPEGRYLATANANGTVYLFAIPQPDQGAQ